MANLASISDMKHRVAATEVKLGAAAQEDHVRNARMVDFLERVEKNIECKQQQISDLQEEQSRSHDEIQLLRTMLHDMLTLAENTLERGPRLGPDDLKQLIDRLDAITPVMNQDAEEDASEVCAKEPDAPPAPPVRKRRASKVLAFFGASVA
jgi:predicted nuclease with TOPRIM domain